jgi:hypothetical protein
VAQIAHPHSFVGPGIMRKFFYRFGIVMACLVVAAGIGLFFLARNGMALDAESKAYVDKAVVAIADDWDADALWQRSSPRFRKATKEDDLRNFFAAARGALGRLVECRSTSGQATVMLTPTGSVTTASYTVEAQFEKGVAEIRIGAVKDGSQWRIEGFHIDSAALMRSLVGLRS